MCKLLTYLFSSLVNNQKTKPKSYNHYLYSFFDINVVTLLNIWREEKNLTVLQKDLSIVLDIAGDHAKWLSDNIIDLDDFKKRGHYFNNERFDQIQIYYPDAKISENISKGYISPQSVVAAWDRSEPHARTMYGDYTHVAVGSCDKFVVAIFTKR